EKNIIFIGKRVLSLRPSLTSGTTFLRVSQTMKSPTYPLGIHYQFPFVNRQERAELLKWLETLVPLWEMRFSENNPPPPGDQQRPLLRPVYWLGNWQFACLDYYHPPQGILNRCVRAE